MEELLPCQAQAVIKLHPRLFHAPYPPRYVNNLYLDTPDLENYYDNVNGADRRCKVRVRWYGAPLGPVNQPVLEIKVKDGLVGTKHTYALRPFRLEQGFGSHAFRSEAMMAGLPENVRFRLRDLEVVLFNRYYRSYFATHDGLFRVTLDSEMRFHKANGALGNAFIHRQMDSRDLVVELKYEVDQEPSADRVAGFFPFRVTRNSKYVQGVERVYF